MAHWHHWSFPVCNPVCIRHQDRQSKAGHPLLLAQRESARCWRKEWWVKCQVWIQIVFMRIYLYLYLYLYLVCTPIHCNSCLLQIQNGSACVLSLSFFFIQTPKRVSARLAARRQVLTEHDTNTSTCSSNGNSSACPISGSKTTTTKDVSLISCTSYNDFAVS